MTGKKKSKKQRARGVHQPIQTHTAPTEVDKDCMSAAEHDTGARKNHWQSVERNKEEKKRHRRLIASPKKHTKLQNRMSVPEKISSHSFLLTTEV